MISSHQSSVIRAVPGREDGVRIVNEGEPPALPEHEVLQMSISRCEQSVEESGLDEGGGVDPPKLPNQGAHSAGCQIR